jgi:tRNA dimethylallyltransferase
MSIPKSHKPKIIIIAGATASGKSALAVAVAKKFKGEVISADSRQVYRGLDIGTAKMTPSEMEGIPHHLIDIREINEVYSASDFKNDATSAIADITQRKHLPIVAGGTYFYIDVLLSRITPAPVSPNWALRESLEKKSIAELALELEKKDPQRYSTIERQNKRRLVRALEIAHSLDYVPLPSVSELPYQVLTIAIKTDKEELRGRYKERATSWLSNGFREEVTSLLEQGITRERLGEIGFEYTLMLELIDSTITEDKFIQKFIEKNWQYAKRQLMWLKKDQDIVWVNRDDIEVFNIIKDFLS